MLPLTAVLGEETWLKSSIISHYAAAGVLGLGTDVKEQRGGAAGRHGFLEELARHMTNRGESVLDVLPPL
jgi:hypothetical protein